MSAVFSTPSFLKALAPLAKENQVSNKVYKAKLAAKAKRVKEIEQTRKIADKMDKELTKLEKIAEKEAIKQAKIAEKEANLMTPSIPSASSRQVLMRLTPRVPSTTKLM